MYLDAKFEQLAEYDAAIAGDVDADACIVGFGELPDQVFSALCAACAGIGMPDPVIVDASLVGDPARATFVVEALDPAAIIVADGHALRWLPCKAAAQCRDTLVGAPVRGVRIVPGRFV